MDFAENQVVFTILIIIHVAGAIAGIGPTFAFSVLGPMAGQEGPEGGRSIMRAMVKIEKSLVNPVAYGTQWISGALLILGRPIIRNNFFREEWLVASIVAYIAIMVLSMKTSKAQHKMLEMMDGGTAGTPEFGALAQQVQKTGPIMGALTTFIVLMMIWKPLSECAGSLLRC